VLVWAVFGAVFLLLQNLLTFIVFITLFYALWYGIVETWNLPFRPPSTTWQVPSQWVKNNSFFKRSLVWGITLGPGLMTRNPYAGMWLLIWLVALGQNIFVGMLVGLVHGTARALGILQNLKQIKKTAHNKILATQSQWRVLDGAVLLIIAGLLIGYLLKS
jgi:hypothetical protein